jgi:hypothetical protein
MQRAAGLSCDRMIMEYTHVEQRAMLLTLYVRAITAERVLTQGNLVYLIPVDEIQKRFYLNTFKKFYIAMFQSLFG